MIPGTLSVVKWQAFFSGRTHRSITLFSERFRRSLPAAKVKN